MVESVVVWAQLVVEIVWSPSGAYQVVLLIFSWIEFCMAWVMDMIEIVSTLNTDFNIGVRKASKLKSEVTQATDLI